MEPIRVVVDTGFPWVQLFSAISTFVIGIAVAYVAWRQHRVAQLQLRESLFERRFAIYRSAWDAIGIVYSPVSNLEQEFEAESEVARIWHEAQFLFPCGQVEARLDALRKPMNELTTLKNNLEDLRAAYKGQAYPPKAQSRRAENLTQQEALRSNLKEMREDLRTAIRPWLSFPTHS